MAIFIVLWPYLLTTKLRSVIRHNLGHSNVGDMVELEWSQLLRSWVN